MHGAIDSWSLPAGLTSALLTLALVYTRGWLRVRRAAPMAIPSWCLGMFIVGLGTLWMAVAMPLGAIGHGLVFSHMVQHVLLGSVAPPLIWLSAPVLPLSSALPQAVSRGLPRWLSHLTYLTRARRTLRSFGYVVTHPFTAWLAAALTVIAWHVPAAFELAQRSELWHWIQNASFFLTGLLFWWPVVQPWPAAARLPRPAIPLYLLTATFPCDALSAFLVFCDRVVYQPHPADGMSALADQQTAGAIMWVSVTFLYLVPALVLTVQMLSPAQQRLERIGADA